MEKMRYKGENGEASINRANAEAMAYNEERRARRFGYRVLDMTPEEIIQELTEGSNEETDSSSN